MQAIITEQLILSSSKIETKKALFAQIAKVVSDAKRTTNEKGILQDLQKREDIGSTAFENGLMIPHARSKHIKAITLVIVPFADVDFESLDGKKTNFAVAILVPADQENKHLTILSKLSGLFSDASALANFKKASKKAKIDLLEKAITTENAQTPATSSKGSFDVVGVTSCAAGIAHTYMARDALLKAAKAKGYSMKVETRGAVVENKLTAAEIKAAKFVVVAADTKVDKKPFIGKKYYETSTNDAIKNGIKIIEAGATASVLGNPGGASKNAKTERKPKKQNEILRALMTAISYMLPIIVAGGLLFAIPTAIQAASTDSNGKAQDLPEFWAAMQKFGLQGFSKLAIPIIAMYMAYSIGGKPAMAAGLISAYFANDPELLGEFSYLPGAGDNPIGAGFLGGIFIGIFIGYLVKWMRWIKWHRFIAPAAPILIVPLISTFIGFIFVVYVVGPPLSYLMGELYEGLANLQSNSKWITICIGALFAGLVAFDLGGPVGKISWFVANAIFLDTTSELAMQSGIAPNLMPWTAMTAAISVGPLAMFYATRCFKWKYSKTEIEAGGACLPLGLVGISEGALPFAFANPLKFVIANVTGGVVAGALVTAFSINYWGGLGSPIGAWLGYVDDGAFGFLWALCIIIGVLVSGSLFTLLRKREPAYQEEYKEYKAAKVQMWKERNVQPGFKNVPKKWAYYGRQFRRKFKPAVKYMANPKNWVQKPSDW